MASFDSEFSKAISKFSSMGLGHLKLNLTEQVLVSTELDISEQYPNMKNDPNYQTTLIAVKTLKGFPYSN